MITRNKVLLITKSTAVAKFVRSFEAVEEINDISQTSRVWENNKTPVILGAANVNCPAIYLPEEGFVDDKAFIEFSHENGFECGEMITLASSMTVTRNGVSCVSLLLSRACPPLWKRTIGL